MKILTPDDVANQPQPLGSRGLELIHGRTAAVPALPAEHRRLQSDLVRRIAEHLMARRLDGCVLGDVGFVLGLRRDAGRLRIADIALVARHHFDGFAEPERVLRGAPQLVVEISPSNCRKPDATQRMIDFLEAGVSVFWLLDPCTREALVYNAGECGRIVRADELIDAAPVLPALRIPLGQLFPIH